MLAVTLYIENAREAYTYTDSCIVESAREGVYTDSCYMVEKASMLLKLYTGSYFIGVASMIFLKLYMYRVYIIPYE